MSECNHTAAQANECWCAEPTKEVLDFWAKRNIIVMNRTLMSYDTPHQKGDLGTEDHIDCCFCNATEYNAVFDEVLKEEIGYLLGKMMIKLKGKGNPALVAELIKGRVKTTI